MSAEFDELIVSTFPNAKALPLWIGRELGFFDRLGLRIAIDATENSAQQRKNLQSGRIHVAQAAIDNALDLIVRGIDAVIVMGGESGMNEFVVQPEIKRFEDFKGFTLAVDSPHTAYALQAKKLLSLHGLEANRDYKVEAVGNSGRRFDALKASALYGGAVLNPPYSTQARALGFGVLGRLVELLGPYQAGGAFVLRSFACERGSVLEAYIQAYVEALRWLRSPANRAAAEAILSRELRLAPSIASATFDALLDPISGFGVDAKLDHEGLRNVLATRAEMVGEDPRLTDLRSFVDENFYRRAVSRLA